MADWIAVLTRPVFDLLGPERAHEAALTALRAGLYPRPTRPDDPRLAIELFGLNFPNPIGIAAGFDKNAEVVKPILDLGFGFAEAGTVTPKPQPGNPQPRVFRLPHEHGIINRLGFNNEGHGRAVERLKRLGPDHGIVGINIGANKDSADRIEDYVVGLRAFYGLASYFTINISSPNTPGLRGLQSKDSFDELLGRIITARGELESGQAMKTPVLVKISPGLSDDELADIAQSCLSAGIDGVIISNTTVMRDNVQGRHAHETGGLSGRPLFLQSTRTLARFYTLTDGKIPLIGVGGVENTETAYAKITAGASLIQLYTGLVYQGLGLVSKIKRGLLERLAADGHTSLQQAIGSAAVSRAKSG